MKNDLSQANWFKSSRSAGGKDCVEVAFLGRGDIGVRDSEDRGGPALVFSGEQWDRFLASGVWKR
ncbi:DUF397 domain-containing protein [Nocardia seriolae]|uniref:DUF397 domain-containing protein n=1 Tax=Nocardia seriolae TaxID=37332 RepID=A0ABC8ANA7_9NOCA|nr:DUF397 domain-containing protein [Nocardia seriolae]APA95708.1 hypothetical protein NS506_01638 [Nocardia seriolae]MTJ66175.1 DUF397 domain-containing protein [Nocardia seriolae]MTJ76264.1 DUF397 domain-containing protein [Nocardia seriolae]MTJ85911.1 DUF397 domain-containing protein [Nocardia seriolae]MTK29905.1 DUF397 domain-containing protein [Nocardia seriolae]